MEYEYKKTVNFTRNATGLATDAMYRYNGKVLHLFAGGWSKSDAEFFDWYNPKHFVQTLLDPQGNPLKIKDGKDMKCNHMKLEDLAIGNAFKLHGKAWFIGSDSYIGEGDCVDNPLDDDFFDEDEIVEDLGPASLSVKDGKYKVTVLADPVPEPVKPKLTEKDLKPGDVYRFGKETVVWIRLANGSASFPAGERYWSSLDSDCEVTYLGNISTAFTPKTSP